MTSSQTLEGPGAHAVDLAKIERAFAGARATFASARPYPHVVIDDFLDPVMASTMAAEFDDAGEGWTFYHHVNEKKRGLADVSRMGPVSRAVIAALSAPRCIAALEQMTGVTGLLADPDLDGGGLHETRAGGHLNVHTDFLSHTIRRTWSRQLNLLLFLNHDWPESYRGWLELWDDQVRRCERRIAPIFNRCVVFRTTARSFHGVPAGVACPENRSRRSLALYYFRDEGRELSLRPTRYVPLPSDGPMRRLLIRADLFAVRVYSLLKRYTPLGDRIVSSILKRL